MNENETNKPGIRRHLVALLKTRVWIAEHLRPSELQSTLFWAGTVGFLGAVASVLFRKLTDLVQWLLTQQRGDLVESLARLPMWQRLITPVIGGALAGAVIALGTRLNRSKSSTDYMEAIVLGDGVLSARSSLVKCVSALFTIASGGSIGREGPLVQLAAMCASLIGRWQRWPAPRRRLIVACGAAAGIASAYNAPIAGALFVAEIILGSLAMESFGPLVFSSVIATLTVRQVFGENPLYGKIDFRLNSNWEIVPYLGLGLAAGLIAPWFLKLLRLSETWFEKTRLPFVPRLALGGVIVGLLCMLHPDVSGNGYNAVRAILNGNSLWQALLVFFLFKVIATGATFGSGAVGGVFTPTLFVGASLGYLFGTGAQAVWAGVPLNPIAFALVGMGAFLAATTHAPIMAVLMIFEMTLDYEIILPLMLGCVVSYYVSLNFEKQSIYSESLRRKGARDFDEQLAQMRVLDLMKPDPPAVPAAAHFHEIAQSFIAHRFNYLYVVDDLKRLVGAISLHDIKGYLNEPEIAEVVIAGDIVHEEFPSITPEVSLGEALEKFSRHDGERLPVINNTMERKLVGRISKTDLILAIAQRSHETPDGK